MTALAWVVAVTVIYYLLTRAEISRPFWTRLPGFLDRLARCSACSGVWIGAGLSLCLPPPYAGSGTLLAKLVWGGAWGLVSCTVGTAILVTAKKIGQVEEETEE